MVSFNWFQKVLKLTNKKVLSDESVLKKIERFSNQGVERDFFVDGKKIAKIIPRLTGIKDAQNWLSMQPNPLRWFKDCRGDVLVSFGEINKKNRLHGRGIEIKDDGDDGEFITIGHFKNGLCTGHYISISS